MKWSINHHHQYYPSLNFHQTVQVPICILSTHSGWQLLLVGGVFNNQQPIKDKKNKNHTQIDLDDSNEGDQSGHYDGDTKGTGLFSHRASWFRSSVVVVVAFTTKSSWSKKSK